MTGMEEDRPAVAIHPPTLFFSALIIGFIIRIFAGGWMPLPDIAAEGAGGVMMLAALAVAIASVSSFAEAGEQLPPATPSHQLLTTGMYARSRNPIYLAMVLFGAGFGVATENLWVVITTVLAGVILNFFVIPQEEEYLARRFGGEYEDYRRRVRRWV